MKRLLIIIICALMSLSVSGCVKEEPEQPTDLPQTAEERKVDMNLSPMSFQMLYATIENIENNPHKYQGKIIQISGKFATEQNSHSGETVYCLYQLDGPGCCQAAMSLELRNSGSELPQLEEWATAVGRYDCEVIDGVEYWGLYDAEIVNE